MNSFNTRSELDVGGKRYQYYSLPKLAEAGYDVARLPYVHKVLLENLLRNEDGLAVTKDQIEAVANWDPAAEPTQEISFTPARVLLQDFTGVPAVVDLAAMRDAIADLGGDASKINPQFPAELVIDHSVQVDAFGTAGAFQINADMETSRNLERYAFLRWGQTAFEGFKVVPPDTGIVHQVNLEFLARVVFDREDGMAYPDTLVGTDSHTPMVNGLGVLAWGVGGIEAEAAMLGQAIPLLLPQVVGFKLTGALPEGATATDLVLTVVQMLRAKGVVGKFVEFFGPGIANLSLADRATLGNMAPEYGATVGVTPIDEETLNYLRLSARDDERIALVEAYAKAQGMFHTADSPEPVYSDTLALDLASVVPCMAGPKLPHFRIPLTECSASFKGTLSEYRGNGGGGGTATAVAPPVVTMQQPDGSTTEFELADGSVVIAAITSCTNTSNPSVMLGAGLVARKAAARGLKRKPWVKTSLAPGSMVVTSYLEKADLMKDLEALDFHLVGYGCTTCIGNSGPLPAPIAAAVTEHDVYVCSVLSGNRNFEGRVNPHTRANYLASPPLVVAYAIAGRMDIDLTSEPLGQDTEGNDVFLKDIWPTQAEVNQAVADSVEPAQFRDRYEGVYAGDARWQALQIPEGQRFAWPADSTYIRQPTFFEGMTREVPALSDIAGARVLCLLGDSVTTDHISPAGSIAPDGPAAAYLMERGVERKDFNSFGSRRGNHEVMIRGTFANIRLRNQLAPGTEGGWTRHQPSGEQLSIFDASERYKTEGTPLVVIAGKEYGTGSSRDWAAKGTLLLGVKAVIAQSYERIHRSNLIGMGVLPLQFADGQSAASLGLDGTEEFSIRGVTGVTPGGQLTVRAGSTEFTVTARIDTPVELEYYRHGGILQYVLRQLLER